MRAAVFSEHGGPGVVGIGEVPLPEPGPGEVRLQVAAAALNHLDVWVRRGLPIQTTMPHVGGADVAGVVDALGTGVTAVRIEDRVVVNPSLWCGACEWCARGQHPLCLTYRILGEHVQGGFAEFVVVPARNLYPVPAGYPMETAAAAPLAFLTAWRALAKRARLTAGESVLITGASGGVATAAIRIARHLGARVYAVTSGDNVERVRSLGADVVYDRDEVDFGKGVWRDTGRRGVDVVLDSVGQATWPRVVRSAARGGRIVVYGATTGPALETDGRVLFWKQLDVLGTTMSTHAEFEEVMELVFSGALEPVIDVVWPLDRARDAHERLEAGAQFGKIVLVP
ncbi:MAG: alcohol dehydrogenase catalytic domain-containing protein [Gemmatimonadota bacterium]